jgi:hypothetical protein
MREKINTVIDGDYKRALKELSEETMIPQSKLLDKALEELFKIYGKEVKK